MPLSHLPHWRLPAFLLALLLLAGVGATSVWGIVEFSRSASWVEQSYRVLAGIQGVESATHAVESAARAYRLTGQPEQHAEYLAAEPEAVARSNALVALVADDSGQQARARQLQRRVRERLAELARLVRIQNEHGAERARTAMQSSRGPELMQAVTATAADMLGAERGLLEAREAASARRAQWLTGFVVLGTVLPMVLLGLLLAGLARENRRSRRLENEARAAMRELETSLVQRDRLSEQRRSLGSYTGLLQSCQDLDEAMVLTGNVLHELLPHAGGRCYVMHASQNVAESAATFGTPAAPSGELLQPGQCWALRRGQMHCCEPGRGQVPCAHFTIDQPDDTSTLCVPMVAHGTSIGLLHVSGRGGWGPGDTDAVESVAEQLSQTIANLQLRESLRVQSLRDPLTGLYNRRYLEENLYRELQRCERRGLPLAVMMLDVDHFKRFNDEHGHAAGDAVLARVAEVLVRFTRGEDIACRYGGEEFTIVMPEADFDVAIRRAEDIRAAIGGTTVIHMRQPLGAVTASIGVACFPEDGASPERLLAAADSALYRAKAQGRDRVVASR